MVLVIDGGLIANGVLFRRAAALKSLDHPLKTFAPPELVSLSHLYLWAACGGAAGAGFTTP